MPRSVWSVWAENETEGPGRTRFTGDRRLGGRDMSRRIAFGRRLSRSACEIWVNSGPYVSKTDQTAQTDRHIENQGKFAPSPGRKLTMRHSKLTSGPDHGGLAGASAP